MAKKKLEKDEMVKKDKAAKVKKIKSKNLADLFLAEDFSYTAEDVQGDTVKDRVEYAHGLYMSNLLPLMQYWIVLKREHAISPEQTHKAFSEQVFIDWRWLKIFKNIDIRLKELLNSDDLAEKIAKQRP